ncbi:putative reverse transcriptase domain-containing protein [Tanacetum coccineum]
MLNSQRLSRAAVTADASQIREQVRDRYRNGGLQAGQRREDARSLTLSLAYFKELFLPQFFPIGAERRGLRKREDIPRTFVGSSQFIPRPYPIHGLLMLFQVADVCSQLLRSFETGDDYDRPERSDKRVNLQNSVLMLGQRTNGTGVSSPTELPTLVPSKTRHRPRVILIPCSGTHVDSRHPGIGVVDAACTCFNASSWSNLRADGKRNTGCLDRQDSSLILLVAIFMTHDDFRVSHISRTANCFLRYSRRYFLPEELHVKNSTYSRCLNSNIELIPGAEPISKAPYRMAPIEFERVEGSYCKSFVKAEFIRSQRCIAMGCTSFGAKAVSPNRFKINRLPSVTIEEQDISADCISYQALMATMNFCYAFGLTNASSSHMAKGEKFVWNKSERRALKKLKHVFLRNLFSTLPSGSWWIQIIVMLSKKGLGSVHHQHGKVMCLRITTLKPYKGTKLCVPEIPALREVKSALRRVLDDRLAHSSPFSFIQGSTKMIMISRHHFCGVIREDLSYTEEPESILDRQVRVMRNKTIPFVKILWRNHPEREATWETEESIRTSYPHFLP